MLFLHHGHQHHGHRYLVQDKGHDEAPINHIECQRPMNMAVVVMVVVVHDWHAFQRGMQSQTDQGGPWKSTQCEGLVTVTSMFMACGEWPCSMPFRQKFEESLKQESDQHEEACQVGRVIRLRHKVQEAHANDEGPAKGEDDWQIVHASLSEKHKDPSAQQCGGQEDQCRQNHVDVVGSSDKIMHLGEDGVHSFKS